MRVQCCHRTRAHKVSHNTRRFAGLYKNSNCAIFSLPGGGLYYNGGALQHFFVLLCIAIRAFFFFFLHNPKLLDKSARAFLAVYAASIVPLNTVLKTSSAIREL